jgi:hypothetical protein
VENRTAKKAFFGMARANLSLNLSRRPAASWARFCINAGASSEKKNANRYVNAGESKFNTDLLNAAAEAVVGLYL